MRLLRLPDTVRDCLTPVQDLLDLLYVLVLSVKQPLFLLNNCQLSISAVRSAKALEIWL